MNVYDPDNDVADLDPEAQEAPQVQAVGPTVNVPDNFNVMGASSQVFDPDNEPPAQQEYASTNPADEPQFAGHQKKSLREMMGERRDLLFDSSGTFAERMAKRDAKEREIAGETKRLWKDESIIGHAISAYKKGVFDKPLSELIKSGKEVVGKQVENFSLRKLVDFAIKKPGKFGDALVDSVVADPELLLPFFWEALGGRVGAVGMRLAGEVGQATGKALEVGLTGAGVAGGMSTARQLDEKGFINPSDLMDEMKVGAALAAGMSVVGTLAGRVAGVKPKEVMPSVEYHMQEGDDIMTAMSKAMEEKGVPKAEADELAAALKKTGDEDSDKNFLSLRKEVEAMLPKEEAPQVMTSKQAQADLGRMAKELQASRKSGEISESDFNRMMEGVKQSEAARVAKEIEPVQVHDPDVPLRDEQAMEAAAAKQRIETGQAKAVGEEPSTLAARAQQIMSMKTMSPSQAKELTDIKTYLEVLPEMGASQKDAAAMITSQAKAFVEAKLPGASLDVAAKVEAPRLMLGETSAGMRQRGVMSPEMAKWIGATAAGAATVGYFSDDKAKGAAIGAALVLGGPIAMKAIRGMNRSANEAAEIGIKKFASLKRDPKIMKQTDDIISAHEGLIATRGIQADRHMAAIKKLVPKADRQIELGRAIQAGKIHTLSPNEQAAAVAHQEFVKDIGDRAVSKGLIDALINDGTYLTGMWKDSEKARALFSAANANTRFSKHKIIPDYDTGIAFGLEPKSQNVGEIDNMYAKAMGRAEANLELLNTLKTVKVDGINAKPIMTGEERSLAIAKLMNKPNLNAIEQSELTTLTKYKQNPHPQLQGMFLHPEMAPSLGHVFYSTNIPPYLNTMLAVSAAAKSGLFAMSLFHVKSLIEVGIGVAIGMRSKKVFTGMPEMYRTIQKGAAGDFAERAVGKGLNISHGGFDMDGDMVTKLLNTASDTIDKLPVAGKALSLPVKGLGKIQEALMDGLWGRLHPSAKLSTVSVAYEKALLKHAKIHAKDPTAKVPSPDEILGEVVQVTNDLYGGINWRKITDSIQNRWLHKQMSSLSNPEGLRALRIALIAPDWLVSTVRAGVKGGISAAKGFIPGTKMSIADDMYRRYFLGMGLTAAVLMEGVQQAKTGTHFWENEDPLSIDNGDGTSTNLFKHFGEIFHLMADPANFTVNKIGYLPKESVSQLGSREYVSTKGSPPMENTSPVGRVGHALKGMLPISSQEVIAGRPGRALSGALGFPTKGTSREERLEQRAARVAKRNSVEGMEIARKQKEARQRLRHNRGE